MRPATLPHIGGFSPLVGSVTPLVVKVLTADRLPLTGCVPALCRPSSLGMADMQKEIDHNGQKDGAITKYVHKNTKTQSDTQK